MPEKAGRARRQKDGITATFRIVPVSGVEHAEYYYSTSVSYTHLDVYKRQVFDRQAQSKFRTFVGVFPAGTQLVEGDV